MLAYIWLSTLHSPGSCRCLHKKFNKYGSIIVFLLDKAIASISQINLYKETWADLFWVQLVVLHDYTSNDIVLEIHRLISEKFHLCVK